MRGVQQVFPVHDQVALPGPPVVAAGESGQASAAGIAAFPVPAATSSTRFPDPTPAASTSSLPSPGMSSAATEG